MTDEIDHQIIEENHPGIGEALTGMVLFVAEKFPGVRLTLIARDIESEPGKMGVCVVSGDDDMDAVVSLVAKIAGIERGPTQ